MQSFIKLSVKIYILLSFTLLAHAQEYVSGPYIFSAGALPATEISFTRNEIRNGLTAITVVFKAGVAAALPKELTVRWSVPLIGITGCWTPNGNEPRFIRMNAGISSNISSQAPVICFFGQNSSNRYTFALSDAFHQTTLKASVNEEEARLNCTAGILLDQQENNTAYSVTILLDNRQVPFYESLKQVSVWWAAMPEYLPETVPAAAKSPMYSTWYSYHQQISEKALLNECVKARSLGYETIIVDDGWQTLNNARGYAYTGDWNPERIGNMADFVKKVHHTGMKCMLWYSVPFIGYHAAAYPQFKGKYLYSSDHLSASVLDPRYPQARRFIVEKYLHDLKEWDIDGFKLDFIDSFTNQTEEPPAVAGEADFLSLYAAVDQLMMDIKKALTAAKPDILIEFRQSYIGPAMRKYGNMFRAGDCPEAAMTNRVRTTDIRLLAGTTAVHADMLSWNMAEPADLAALSFLNVLFSVPQLSVKLDGLPVAHLNMVRFYTRYWIENKDILLNGYFRPLNPELNYPLLISEKNNKVIVGVYADEVIRIKGKYKALDIINAKSTQDIILQNGYPMNCETKIFDCEGRLLKKSTVRLVKGINHFRVPLSGMIAIHRVVQ